MDLFILFLKTTMEQHINGNSLTSPILTIGLSLFSVMLNFIEVNAMDENLIVPIMHLTQLAAAGMAIFVGYRTIKKDSK